MINSVTQWAFSIIHMHINKEINKTGLVFIEKLKPIPSCIGPKAEKAPIKRDQFLKCYICVRF